MALQCKLLSKVALILVIALITGLSKIYSLNDFVQDQAKHSVFALKDGLLTIKVLGQNLHVVMEIVTQFLWQM